jgi:hypothetical protein
VYAFLEAQGFVGAATPALAQLGLAGCAGVTGPDLLLGSALGRSALVGIPGYYSPSTVVIDQPGVGLVAVADVTVAVQPQPFESAEDYVTVVDPSLLDGVTTVLTEDAMHERREGLVACTRLGAAAEMLGIVDRVLTDATEYAQQRRQFGRPIASNQSMQHLLAWASTERHQLSALLDIAVARTPTADPELAQAVKAMAGRTLHAVVQAAIQATGAISFTWEYPQHHHHRRGLALDQLAGASADLVAAIGREVRSQGVVPELFGLHDALR